MNVPSLKSSVSWLRSLPGLPQGVCLWYAIPWLEVSVITYFMSSWPHWAGSPSVAVCPHPPAASSRSRPLEDLNSWGMKEALRAWLSGLPCWESFLGGQMNRMPE